jgi:hypothetical protein
MKKKRPSLNRQKQPKRPKQPRKATQQISPHDNRFIAIHAAACAVAAVHYGLPFEFEHIESLVLPDGRVLVGLTVCQVPMPPGETEALPWIIQVTAGSLDVRRLHGNADPVIEAFADDIDGAERIAKVAICPPTIRPDYEREMLSDVIEAHMEKLKPALIAAKAPANELVDKYWETIVAVANALIAHREPTAEQIAAIMQDQQSANTPV